LPKAQSSAFSLAQRFDPLAPLLCVQLEFDVHLVQGLHVLLKQARQTVLRAAHALPVGAKDLLFGWLLFLTRIPVLMNPARERCSDRDALRFVLEESDPILLDEFRSPAAQFRIAIELIEAAAPKRVVPQQERQHV